MTDLLNQIQSDLNLITLKATKTTPRSKMPKGEPWDTIKQLYKKEAVEVRLLVAQLNALFTERKFLFISSKRILAELLESDPNLKRKTINANDYQKFFRWTTAGYFAIRQAPSKFSRGKLVAGAYELVNPKLRGLLEEMLGEDKCRELKEKFWSLYRQTSHAIGSGNGDASDNGIETVNETTNITESKNENEDEGESRSESVGENKNIKMVEKINSYEEVRTSNSCTNKLDSSEILPVNSSLDCSFKDRINKVAEYNSANQYLNSDFSSETFPKKEKKTFLYEKETIPERKEGFTTLKEEVRLELPNSHSASDEASCQDRNILIKESSLKKEDQASLKEKESFASEGQVHPEGSYCHSAFSEASCQNENIPKEDTITYPNEDHEYCSVVKRRLTKVMPLAGHPLQMNLLLNQIEPLILAGCFRNCERLVQFIARVADLNKKPYSKGLREPVSDDIRDKVIEVCKEFYSSLAGQIDPTTKLELKFILRTMAIYNEKDEVLNILRYFYDRNEFQRDDEIKEILDQAIIEAETQLPESDEMDDEEADIDPFYGFREAVMEGLKYCF